MLTKIHNKNLKFIFVITLISFFIAYFIEQYYFLNKGWSFLLELVN
jgi:hypothetical protein